MANRQNKESQSSKTSFSGGEKLNFDKEAPKSKKPRYEELVVVPTPKPSIKVETPTKQPKKEEVTLRKMVSVSEEGEEFLFGFFVIGAVKVKDDIDGLGEVFGSDDQGKDYFYITIIFNEISNLMLLTTC
jgi:hypothetical protein